MKSTIRKQNYINICYVSAYIYIIFDKTHYSVSFVSAGMYAYFKREDMVYTLGKGVGYEKTESNIDCLLQCLMTSDCNGVIILDKFHCLLYHQ